MTKAKSRFFLLITIFLSFSIFSCKKNIEAKSQKILGTICTINLYEGGTEKIYKKLFDCLFEIDKIFNPYREDSEIFFVNKNAGKNEIEVSDEFAFVLNAALFISETTDGAFDPALGAVVDAWGINNKQNELPADAAPPESAVLKNALKNSHWKLVELSHSNGKNFLKIPKGLKIDLGGIVKGYASDCLEKILKKENVKCAVINLGGNIYLHGQKTDGSPWLVGVKDPKNPEGNPAISLTGLKNTSIVTSGVYERFFSHNGKLFHHIIDPKTGEPSENGIVSVTVICPRSIFADALATAFLVMGADEAFKKIDILNYAQEFRGENRPLLIAITETGKIIASEELKGIAGLFLDDYTLEFQ